MMPPTLIAPSVLSADPLNLAAELAQTEQAGADWHHIDVMDGHFVPNLTFGLPVIRAIKKITSIPLDVHIMIANPDQMAAAYVEAGADILTFHAEATLHPHRLIQQIKSLGAKAGVALNPGSPTLLAEPLLDEADLILVMSVNPGFGGQAFIRQTVDRIKALRGHMERNSHLGTLIQVDGGITEKTAAFVRGAGADCLVSGTTVYGAKDRAAVITSLKVAQNV